MCDLYSNYDFDELLAQQLQEEENLAEKEKNSDSKNNEAATNNDNKDHNTNNNKNVSRNNNRDADINSSTDNINWVELIENDPELALALSHSTGTDLNNYIDLTSNDENNYLYSDDSDKGEFQTRSGRIYRDNPEAELRLQQQSNERRKRMKILDRNNSANNNLVRKGVSLAELLNASHTYLHQIQQLTAQIYKPNNKSSSSSAAAHIQSTADNKYFHSNSNRKLKDYQLEAVEWLKSLLTIRLGGAILADEVGLGKTITTIAFLTCARQILAPQLNNSHGLFYLVVAPLSTLAHWQDSLKLWTHHISTLLHTAVVNQLNNSSDNLQDNKLVRRRLLEEFLTLNSAEISVVLTSYELILADYGLFDKFRSKFTIMVVDEAGRLKNTETRLYTALNRFNTEFRLLLSATPLQNNLKELFSLLQFIQPNLFKLNHENSNNSSADTNWQSHFFSIFTEFNRSSSLQSLLANNSAYKQLLSNFHSALRPFLLRRTAALVLTHSPIQSKQVILPCKLSLLQRKLYENIRRRAEQQLIGEDRRETAEEKEVNANSTVFTVKNFNNILMQLRKVCISPYLFNKTQPEVISLIRSSGKLQVLHELLSKLLAANHRILIFSQFVLALDLIENVLLASKHYKNRYARLDGSVPAAERSQLIQEFEASSSRLSLFLLSSRAGGLGINLSTADTVILFDNDWNPAVDVQAIGRALRMTQKNFVMIYRLICSGTVEEKIFQVANQKLKLEHQIIRQGNFNSLANMTKDHVENQNNNSAALAETNNQSLLQEILSMKLLDNNDNIAINASKLEAAKSQHSFNEAIAAPLAADAELALFDQLDADYPLYPAPSKRSKQIDILKAKIPLSSEDCAKTDEELDEGMVAAALSNSNSSSDRNSSEINAANIQTDSQRSRNRSNSSGGNHSSNDRQLPPSAAKKVSRKTKSNKRKQAADEEWEDYSHLVPQENLQEEEDRDTEEILLSTLYDESNESDESEQLLLWYNLFAQQ
jgi:ATP-dependent DNA helicase